MMRLVPDGLREAAAALWERRAGRSLSSSSTAMLEEPSSAHAAVSTMPYIDNPYICKTVYDVYSIITGCVVNYNEFKMRVCLVQNAADRTGQKESAIMRGDDNADARSRQGQTIIVSHMLKKSYQLSTHPYILESKIY